MVQAGGKPSNFVLVKVVAFQKGKALCKARFERNWHKIVMIQGSIKRADPRESDAFEWIPNDDGIVAGRAKEYHDRAYGGHDDIWGEWGVEFRGRKIKEGGHTPLA